MQDFTKLKVWQKAHVFTVNLYKITNSFPDQEKYGLVNQLRRAAISIESNIAEGCGRDGDKEFSRFLDIAQGSAYEVRCQIFVARDLEYITVEKFDLLDNKITEISRMLNSLKQKLKANSAWGMARLPRHIQPRKTLTANS